MDYFEDLTTTEAPRATYSATLRLYDIFIPLLGVFIITLNLLVVISSGLLLKKRQQPRSTYLFLGNLALSDLLTGIAVLFGQLYPRQLRSDMSCTIHMGMIVSSTLVSVLSVLLVAIDRFLYILFGLQYQRYIYPNRARVLILTTWIAGIIVGFLPTVVVSLRGDINGRRCWFISMNPEYILSVTIVGSLPVVIVVILYSLILAKALKKVGELKKATSAQTGAQTGENLRYFRGSAANLNQLREQETTIPLRQQPTPSKQSQLCCWKSQSQPNETQTAVAPSTDRQPSKWKAIKIVFFTTGSFVITWVPYFVASTMFVYCDHENNPKFCSGLQVAIASPLAILGFSNSLLNPIIYAWWHNSFRTNSLRIFSERFKRIKCCRWCSNKSDVASPRATNLSSTTNLSSSTPQVSSATTSTDINPNNIITIESTSRGNDLRAKLETN